MIKYILILLILVGCAPYNNSDVKNIYYNGISCAVKYPKLEARTPYLNKLIAFRMTKCKADSIRIYKAKRDDGGVLSPAFLNANPATAAWNY